MHEPRAPDPWHALPSLEGHVSPKPIHPWVCTIFCFCPATRVSVVLNSAGLLQLHNLRSPSPHQGCAVLVFSIPLGYWHQQPRWLLHRRCVSSHSRDIDGCLLYEAGKYPSVVRIGLSPSATSFSWVFSSGSIAPSTMMASRSWFVDGVKTESAESHCQTANNPPKVPRLRHTITP